MVWGFIYRLKSTWLCVCVYIFTHFSLWLVKEAGQKLGDGPWGVTRPPIPTHKIMKVKNTLFSSPLTSFHSYPCIWTELGGVGTHTHTNCVIKWKASLELASQTVRVLKKPVVATIHSIWCDLDTPPDGYLTLPRRTRSIKKVSIDSRTSTSPLVKSCSIHLFFFLICPCDFFVYSPPGCEHSVWYCETRRRLGRGFIFSFLALCAILCRGILQREIFLFCSLFGFGADNRDYMNPCRHSHGALAGIKI